MSICQNCGMTNGDELCSTCGHLTPSNSWSRGNGDHKANYYFRSGGDLVMQVNWAEGADRAKWMKVLEAAKRNDNLLSDLRKLVGELREEADRMMNADLEPIIEDSLRACADSLKTLIQKHGGEG